MLRSKVLQLGGLFRDPCRRGNSMSGLQQLNDTQCSELIRSIICRAEMTAAGVETTLVTAAATVVVLLEHKASEETVLMVCYLFRHFQTQSAGSSGYQPCRRSCHFLN